MIGGRGVRRNRARTDPHEFLVTIYSTDISWINRHLVLWPPLEFTLSRHILVGTKVGMERTVPKQVKGMTVRQVEAAAKPGMYADGDGLYLQVREGKAKEGKEAKPAKSWIYRFQYEGKRREMGLGSVADISLVQARRLAAAQRETLLGGVDPIEAKRTAEPPKIIPTFGEAADDYIKAHEAGWRNSKHAAQWRMTLGDAYCKVLRAKRVDGIMVSDVLEVLKPVWLIRPETASRVRGRIEAVMDAAKAQGHRSGENPAAWRGNLKHLLPARSKLTRGHHAAMPYKDVADFMKRLREQEGMTALVLEFTVLTAARSGEVLGMTWGEVDEAAKVWTVPGKRMKGAREHRVPLSGAALAVLLKARTVRQDDKAETYVFPGARKGKPLSNMTMEMLLRRMKVDFTVHGFRSSFRDWAGEVSTFPRDIAEAALAHIVGDKVEAAYRRGDALEKRRTMMEAWASFIEPRTGAKVSQFRRA